MEQTTDSLVVEKQLVEQILSGRARIQAELAKVIVGQKEVIEQLLIALFAGGHCLITGAPGLAKTLLVKSLSQIFHLRFQRIQFTPDLMPADITGTEILQESAGGRTMTFVPGPVFANMILADEINRTPPKTQAALLEAMQEHQVTAAGVRHPLPEPFFELATQNPIEMEGTYPLHEAQLDRFMFNVVITYLPEDEEVAVVVQTTARNAEPIAPLFTGDDVLRFHDIVRKVPVADDFVRVSASPPTTLTTLSRKGLAPLREGAGSLIDPQTLMSIKNLELRARVVVEGFWHGFHRSPYHGFSVEFTEYRQYSPGDDPRYLDWRLYARTDRYFIKKFEDETNLRCHLLVDNSRSMTYGSLTYTKAQYANTLSAALAYFLYLQGDAVGLLTFDERIREYLPARHRAGHLRHLMLRLEQPAGGKATDLAAPLKRIIETVKKRALMVLISDLLAPIETLEKNLTALTASGHEVLLFHILDPAELGFHFEEAVMFHDVESERLLFIDPATARKEYLKKLNVHNAAIQTACQKLGIGYRRFATDRPLDLALFDFLRERMQRGKRTVKVRQYA